MNFEKFKYFVFWKGRRVKVQSKNLKKIIQMKFLKEIKKKRKTGICQNTWRILNYHGTEIALILQSPRNFITFPDTLDINNFTINSIN